VARIDKTIEVEVPVRTAYNQWTQFEEFPRFMEGVQEVRQLADERLFWAAEISGQRKEWYARITRQVPDEVLAWESEGGTANGGTVIFRPKDAGKTEIELHMDYQPEDFKEQVGDTLGFVSRRVEGDLKRFKEFIEARGTETGAWRGEVHHGESVGERGTRTGGSIPGSGTDTSVGRMSDEGRSGMAGDSRPEPDYRETRPDREMPR
jgi:uncharacterized membrane protein